MRSIILLVATVLSGTVLHAQQAFSPDAYDAWNTSALQFGTIPAAPGLLFSQIKKGSGNNDSSDPNGVMALSWASTDKTSAIAAGQHYTFRVEATGSSTVTIDSLKFVLKRNNTGPGSCIIQYKSPATGYSFTDIGTTQTILDPATSALTTFSVIPAAALTAGPTDSIVFRLVAWGATHPFFGALGVQNGTHIYGSAGTPPAAESISAAGITGNEPLCVTGTAGDSIHVFFTSAGTFNAGNTYTLEISDGAGSFSAPLSIGTLSSNTHTGTINGFLPAGIANGSYKLRIVSSDPAVIGLDTTQISVFSGIGLTASVTQPLCAAGIGSIDLTTTGGTMPLSYAWSNSATTEDLSGLSAGNYAVTVAGSNGCVADTSFTIDNIQPIVVSETVNNVQCNGDANGSISVNVSGGTGSISYAWTGYSETSNALSAIDAGTYELTVTDANGCTSVQSYDVLEPAPLAITGNVSDVHCYDGADGRVDLTVSGGAAGYAYTWTGSAETGDTLIGLVAGNYEVTVTDANGCTISEDFIVSEPAAIVLTETITQAACTSCEGSIAVSAAGGNAPYTFLWNDGTPGNSIEGAPGQYCVNVTDNNGCTADACYDIVSTAAISELAGSKLLVYPNPASTYVNLSIPQEMNGELLITDIDGKQVGTYLLNGSETTIDISAWKNGLYFFSMTSAGQTQSGRFVKQ